MKIKFCPKRGSWAKIPGIPAKIPDNDGRILAKWADLVQENRFNPHYQAYLLMSRFTRPLNFGACFQNLTGKQVADMEVFAPLCDRPFP
jgi:hypothetical protein